LKYTTCPQENFPASCPPKKLIHTLHEFWLEGDSLKKHVPRPPKETGHLKEKKPSAEQ